MGRQLVLPLSDNSSIVLEEFGIDIGDTDVQSSFDVMKIPGFRETCLWNVSVTFESKAEQLGTATLGECKRGFMKLTNIESTLEFEYSQTAQVDAAFVVATYDTDGPQFSIYAIVRDDSIELAWQDRIGVLHHNGLILNPTFVARWKSLFDGLD